MPVKIIGALLVLMSGSYTGWILGTQYLKRIRELKELQVALNIFDTEITYGQTILSEALRVSSSALQGPLSRLFEETAEILRKKGGQTFIEIWQYQLKKNYRRNNLVREDMLILKEWGQQVGNSSLANQNKFNSLTIKRLEQAEKRAEKLAEKRVKLMRYAGFLVSLLIIILLY